MSVLDELVDSATDWHAMENWPELRPKATSQSPGVHRRDTTIPLPRLKCALLDFLSCPALGDTAQVTAPYFPSTTTSLATPKLCYSLTYTSGNDLYTLLKAYRLDTYSFARNAIPGSAVFELGSSRTLDQDGTKRHSLCGTLSILDSQQQLMEHEDTKLRGDDEVHMSYYRPLQNANPWWHLGRSLLDVLGDEKLGDIKWAKGPYYPPIVNSLLTQSSVTGRSIFAAKVSRQSSIPTNSIATNGHLESDPLYMRT
ncbi:hypothetical protein BDZ45DRAFT_737359 [Acephala macrosclerotiorum]|nr:hypothetical protein BDZ45DRAFT_737359 [Acephala macrosclerotiorum]